MDKKLYTVCILLGLTFDQTLGMEGKTTRRPPIPQEWRTDKPESRKSEGMIEFSVSCGTTKSGYVTFNEALPIIPSKVRQEGISEIGDRFNEILGKYVFGESKVKKTWNELTVLDTMILKEAMHNNPNIFKETITVEVEHEGKIYYCRMDQSIEDLFDKSIRRAQLGPLQEVISATSSMGYTQSHLGNVVYSPSYILGVLFDSVVEGDMVLDIGGSRGIQTFPMLSLGAHVTVLDLSEEDIRKLEIETSPNIRDKLETVVAKFPSDMRLDSKNWENGFDVILMSHVAHYLSGDQLREGVNKVKLWLKPGGQFFFQALTPYSNPYAWRMLIADEKQQQGDEWPGYFTELEKEGFVKKYPGRVKLYDPRDSMPNYGHPIHPDIIKRELEAQGLEITYINYGTFNQDLTEKRYPVTYHDLEKYVKRHVYPIDGEEASRIKNQLARLPNLLKIVESDANSYKKQYKNPRSPYRTLQSMETVQVIAMKPE